jgi:transcription elongation factor GreA
VAGLAAVGGGVLALGVVAAADVAAGLAHPQVDPARSRGKALLAAGDLLGQLVELDIAVVGAAGHDPTLANICKGAHMADGEAITREGVAALENEIEELEGPARTALAARIKAARELGDLKENAEYHIAKEDQAHLETRIKRLRERLRNAVVVEADAGGDRFAFGLSAEVLDEGSGAVNTWTLVGSTEADLTAGRLSAESPIGRALRDARLGEQVEVETPKGVRTFVVQKLV